LPKARALCRALFSLDQGNIRDHFEIENQVIGEGGFGIVRMVVDRTTRVAYAVKTLPTHRIGTKVMRRERDVMQLLDHPNIIKFCASFEESTCMHLVMELCSGGELFEYIRDGSRLPEAAAMHVMQQALSAVAYLHSHGIVHRDIKLENFLLVSRSSIARSHIKLIDFGMSRRFVPGTHMRTVLGTPDYMSPQLLAGYYNQLSDVWSCGVLMYVLLTSKWPFSGKTSVHLMRSIKRGCVRKEPLRRSAISAEAHHLLGKMLEVDTNIRLSADLALKHDWFHNRPQPVGAGANKRGVGYYARRLRHYQHQIAGQALNALAGNLSEDQWRLLNDAFAVLDRNGDRLLTATRMTETLNKAGLKVAHEELVHILTALDSLHEVGQGGGEGFDLTNLLLMLRGPKHKG